MTIKEAMNRIEKLTYPTVWMINSEIVKEVQALGRFVWNFKEAPEPVVKKPKGIPVRIIYYDGSTEVFESQKSVKDTFKLKDYEFRTLLKSGKRDSKGRRYELVERAEPNE